MKTLKIAGYIFLGIIGIFLIFGFGESGFKILKENQFWTFINTLLLIAILFFVLEKNS